MKYKLDSVAILGASSSIAVAFRELLSYTYPNASIFTFSQNNEDKNIDYNDESSIAQAAKIATEQQALDLVIISNGVLHNKTLSPEKSLGELSHKKFIDIFRINTIIPAMILKHFLPKLNKERPSRCTVLSARVGSISDNQLGGWYAYRASKAALNMIIKNASIEISRKNKNAIIVGLHPGTVDTPLTKPFQSYMKKDIKLFSPQQSVVKLMQVIISLTKENTGKCFAWDGKEILP